MQTECGVGDFVLMDKIDLENFVDNLELRFKSGRIYTYIGEVCVSVNPYKTTNIYDENYVKRYVGKELFENPPHIFAIADAAHKVMKQQRKDACIIISGESGSGKTEASKIIMKYIAAVTNQGGQNDIVRVKNILIQSNAILEAFGNAKTNRNDNSSRFGKYMDIHFDYKGEPIGGHINKYLLEKSRVIYQQNGERNFHSFYQLLTAPEDQLRALNISQNHTDYFYIKQGNVAKVNSINDRSNFREVTASLKQLNFSQDDQNTLWRVVAAILHLGNLDFETKDDKVSVKNSKSVEYVSDLLRVPRKDLERALCERVIAARGDIMRKEHTISEANYGRDGLAKAIYERLFGWIVDKINDVIKVEENNFPYKYQSSLIGVLDIYGFEIFDNNSFEQFCINYCNEKLQQLFIELVLKQEQEEYNREGIEWQNVEYFNNQIICELVEAQHTGILSIMDDACKMTAEKVTDELLLENMDKKLKSHKHYMSRGVKPAEKSLRHKIDFRITHYAGDVTYCIVGFLDKNKDSLYQDFKRLLYNSSDPNLKSMWPEGSQHITEITKRPLTAGSLFKSSMQALVNNLLSKEPYYVRCIKPNDIKSAAAFDVERVKHQVSYLGLVENVRVRRAGFAYRQRYDRFLKRYKMISQFTWPNFRSGSDKEGIRVIMEERGFAKDVKYGKTKIFIRSPRTLFSLEHARNLLIPGIVTLIQKTWRGYQARRLYKKMKAALVMIHAFRMKKIRTYINTLHRKLGNAKQMPDYGKSVQWPAPPYNLRDGAKMLRNIYNRWRAYMVLKKFPQSQWPELRLKVTAASALLHRRSNWGVSRKWEGNYLSHMKENDMYTPFNDAVNNLKNAQHFSMVLFSSFITKFNKFNKTTERVMLVTDLLIFKLDNLKYKNMKEGMAIKDITSLSVSPGNDQLIVIHSPNQNDLVVSLHNKSQDDRIGELIGILSNRYWQLTNKDLPVHVNKIITCYLGKRSRTIHIQVSSEVQMPTFRKDTGNNINYLLPSNYAVVENGSDFIKR